MNARYDMNDVSSFRLFVICRPPVGDASDVTGHIIPETTKPIAVEFWAYLLFVLFFTLLEI